VKVKKMTTKIKNELVSASEEPDTTNCQTDCNVKIAELAYYKAESRGFEPGHELEDWLAAEQEYSCL
jgi:hypothetical protein